MGTELAEKNAGVRWQSMVVRQFTCFTSTSVHILTPEELAEKDAGVCWQLIEV